MRALLFATWLFAGPPAAAGTHVVTGGDTLWQIARGQGCTLAQLRSANPKLVEPLRIGATLALPRCTAVAKPEPAPPPKATAKPTKPEAKKPEAKKPEAKKPEAKLEPPVVLRTHRVAVGDTLSSIAHEHHTTVAALQRLNGLRDTNIVIGKRIIVSRGEPVAEPDADDRAADLRALPAPPKGGLPAPPEDKAEDDDKDKDKDEPAARAESGARLVGAVQLPTDKAYYLRHPKRAWGAPHVVGSTREAIAAVKRRYPDVHRLAVGDISAERGGRLSGHRSHQTGRDVDLGLYFERVPRSYPKRFVAAHVAPLDLAATWALVEAFWRQSKRPGGPVAIFLDYEVQGRLYHYARKRGVARRTLLEVFQYAHGRWARKGLVRHEPAHDDHLHVRFGCPPRDRTCR